MGTKIILRIAALGALTLLWVSACNTLAAGAELATVASPPPPMMLASPMTNRTSLAKPRATPSANAAVSQASTFASTFAHRFPAVKSKPSVAPQVWRFMTDPASIETPPGEIALTVANQYDRELTLALKEAHANHPTSIPAKGQVTLVVTAGMHQWFAHLDGQGRTEGTLFVEAGKRGYVVFGAPFGE